MANKVIESLDHPVIFVVLITFAVCGCSALLTWGFKAAGLPGPAQAVQAP